VNRFIKDNFILELSRELKELERLNTYQIGYSLAEFVKTDRALKKRGFENRNDLRKAIEVCKRELRRLEKKK